VGTLSVPAPVFIRKLRRRSDWGQPTDEQNQRVKDAVDKLFRSQQESEISVYLVSTDEDLRRIALGLNAGRGSLREAVPLIAFLPAELEKLNIQVNQTAGNLPCSHANRLHRDIIATDDQLTELCQTAMNSGRIAGNCSPGMMKEIVDLATKENCRTVITIGLCTVTECN
jgi:hypothetical protein